jgi:hypothetical protein
VWGVLRTVQLLATGPHPKESSEICGTALDVVAMAWLMCVNGKRFRTKHKKENEP